MKWKIQVEAKLKIRAKESKIGVTMKSKIKVEVKLKIGAKIKLKIQIKAKLQFNPYSILSGCPV